MAPNSTGTILSQRLRNQKLVRSDLRDPVEIIAWLGAVQSQDYPGAKWALKLRVHGSPGFSDADLDRAFDEGAILRTHVLRPTWHFVAPADIRWMQALTGPRVQARSDPYCRKLGLDKAVLARSRRVLERSLGGGKHLTRAALGAALTRAGITVDNLGLSFLMMAAELDQVICSGPRQGKQFTYALLDERAPRARVLEADEALAELTKRYYASHGPATVRDFVWWSGLTVKQAKAGLEMVGRAAASETVDGVTYWSVPSATLGKKAHRWLRPGGLSTSQLRRAHECPEGPRSLSRPVGPAAARRVRGVPPPTLDRRHAARRVAAHGERPRDDDHRPPVQTVVADRETRPGRGR